MFKVLDDILAEVRLIRAALVKEPPKPIDPWVPNGIVIAPPMEPILWGYNGHPQTDGIITYPDKNSTAEKLWLVNGQPYTFTISVPEGRTLTEITSAVTPILGYPDPNLHTHHVRALGQEFSIGAGRWEPKLGPGMHYFTVEAVGFTGGTMWQFRYA